MALYERLMGLEQPKIAVHQFMGVMQEFMLGNMTGPQAAAAFGLDAGEQTEALALRDRILLESVANNNLQRRLLGLEFEQVLVVAEDLVAPYNTAAAVKTRFGV